MVSLRIQKICREVQYSEISSESLSRVAQKFYYQNMKGQRRINKLFVSTLISYIPIHLTALFECSNNNDLKAHVNLFFHELLLQALSNKDQLSLFIINIMLRCSDMKPQLRAYYNKFLAWVFFNASDDELKDLLLSALFERLLTR